MNLTALIPIKAQGNKSRLSNVLTLNQRQRLAEWMLTQTLDVVQSTPQIAQVKLIGQGEPFASIAANADIEFVVESEPNLNDALQTEVDQLHQKELPFLILFADLPLLDKASLNTFLTQGMRDDAHLTLAPDAAKQGTNALLYRGELPLEMMYGFDSFQKYLAQSMRLNLNTNTVELSALAHDLDTCDDWARWQSHLKNSGFSLEAVLESPPR